MAVAAEQSGLWTRATTRALLLGGAHALVDAASGFIVFRDIGSGRYDRAAVLTLVLLYNTLAFGGQAPAGALADRLQAWRGLAVLGSLLAAAALALGPLSTAAAVVIVGIGNALFHVGAGGHVLATSGRRATESGVFVGPGAVGLAAGIWLGGKALDRIPERLFRIGFQIVLTVLALRLIWIAVSGF